MDSCKYCVDGGAFEPQSGMLCVHLLSLFYMLENFASEDVAVSFKDCKASGRWSIIAFTTSTESKAP
jgi:hypothetical protein